MSLDMTKIVKAHIAIRDARRVLAEQFNTRDADLKTKQARLEAEMLRFMQASNMDSVRTEAGTFYRQEVIKPSGADWEALYKWIKDHEAFDALERRIKATFIKDYMDEHDGETPPGVNIHREYVARVRRA